MAEETDKFGSLEWFKSWGERLLQGAVEGGLNALTPRTVSAEVPTVTTGSSGSFLGRAVTWLPYALIAAAALVLILVLKKRP